MKNRFSRIGKSLLGAVCLLSTCGVTYSCSDDFDLDETKPSFLGASIYDELKNRTDRKFSTVIRLIDDLDYQDVLSKTGSKTLFVADDDAFAEFFQNTTWTDGNGNRVESYDQLSTAQKRLLLNGSMLNNAYVLEMMTTIQGPVKNLCLRQLSSIAATDSLPYFKWDELPNNLNVESTSDASSTVLTDMRFWDRYRNQAKGGIYLALDKTEPMLTHFLEAQLNEKKIEPSDVSFILGLDGTDKEWNDDRNRSFVYNREIVESDVTCLNGYYNVLDGVLVTPPNMAEMIRQNGLQNSDKSISTKLFSQMLDRFSAPYYDATLTDEYKALHSIAADSVFQKLYISQRNQTGAAITRDPDGEPLGSYPSLSYDPGWNTYSVNNSTKEQDMGAIFAPSDEAMEKFFLHGGGSTLIENYSDRDNNEANLEYNLYQIPLDIVQALVANLMKESFNETVPSKFRTIMNTAQDQMFTADSYPTVQAYKDSISKVLLANNGVVYVTKNLISPPDYAAVSAPVLTDKDSRVMDAIIRADDNYIRDNYESAPLRKFYSTYLKAMQSNFTLFVPTDQSLSNYGYVDPISFASGYAIDYRYWTMVYNRASTTNKHIDVETRAYRYYPTTGLTPTTQRPIGTTYVSLSSDDIDAASSWAPLKKLMLCDMMDHHIIVHDESEENGIDGTKNFYVSRSGAPIYIKRAGDDAVGTNMVVDGGFQIDVNNDEEAVAFDCRVTKGYDLSQGYGNGHTYFLDRPMQATIYNVYEVLSKTSEFSQFFDLCSRLNGYEGDMMEKIFREDGMDDTDWNSEQMKYNIFSPNNADQTTGGRLTASGTNLVRFFNNYRYTIFVPTNEAMQAAYAAGLPSVDDISNYVAEHTDEEGTWDEEKNRITAQGMTTCLINFLKYHFCDGAYFVDKYADSNFTECQSATSDDKGNFIAVGVKHEENALQVQDQRGQIFTVQGSADPVAPANLVNLMARDYELNAEGSNARTIESSSYVVLHGLNNYMLFDPSLDGDFTKAWDTPEAAKAFVKKFRLKK